jgi:hypothetical protein
MRCAFILVDFYLTLSLELTMWAGELLLWPSALLGGHYEGLPR